MDSKIIETGAHSEAGLFLCMHVDSRRGSIHALCQVAGIAFISAQVAAEDCSREAHDLGLRKVKVYVKGPGSGRETALRALSARGFKILSIKDTTPMPHNGTRPPKKRRV